MLIKEGFNSKGTEILYNGMSGEQMKADIFFGPTFYLRLKHMVKDKMNFRARGPRAVLTRQTVQGRANNGGLRIGEMDRDAVIGSGMACFLEESFMERGDEFYIAICNQTGAIAIYNESKNIFLSPMVDGPLKFSKNLEGGLNIKKISRFGRDFSIVRVPYSFKLLYQELKTMNIQMRIITEKNVNNLTNIVQSNTIEKITNLNNIIEVIQYNVNKITWKKITPTEIETKISEIKIPEKSFVEDREISEEEDEEEDLEDAILEFNTKKSCLESVEFKTHNKKFPNIKTDVPYVLDIVDMNDKIIKSFSSLKSEIHNEFMKTHLLNDFIETKLNLFKGSFESKKNTLDYLFFKIRCGYFIQIKGGSVQQFIPFYNVSFKNTWSHLLNISGLRNQKKINQDKERWTATNCLVQLTFKPLVDKYKLDTFMEVYHMFVDLCKQRKIPDID